MFTWIIKNWIYVMQSKAMQSSPLRFNVVIYFDYPSFETIWNIEELNLQGEHFAFTKI